MNDELHEWLTRGQRAKEAAEAIIADANAPEWQQRAVLLTDHFDEHTLMQVAQPQPQYGTVQLNIRRKGVFISVDVNLEDLLAALAQVTGHE